MQKNEDMHPPTIAFITGASSGAGWQFALDLDCDDRIDEIWVSARREQRLAELSKLLKKPVRIIAGDISDSHCRQTLQAQFAKERVSIHTLINSAGFGRFDSFCDIDCNDAMVELNCVALTAITNLALPYMKEGGRIINMASVAAFMPQYNATVYAASKAYVLSFSRALNQELKSRKISVTAVCPNPMETEFMAVNQVDLSDNPIKKLGIEKVEKVTKKALKRSDKGKDISLYSISAYLLYFVSRIMPHRLVLWFERKLSF